LAELRIGTSGWCYKHWMDGVFYAPEVKRGGELVEYCKAFDCVEINSSFYHTPREATLVGWRQKTPEGFLFAYKATRTITHRRELVDVGEPVAFVAGRARLLGPKLGPILWQLSPRFALDAARLAEFLSLLPRDLRHAFEFRHESWFAEAVYGLLGDHGAALVWADTPSYPLRKVTTAGFLYVRLHGHEKLYRSCYTQAQLGEWAEELGRELEAGRDVYVFFDNDAHAYAPRNALELRRMMSGA